MWTNWVVGTVSSTTGTTTVDGWSTGTAGNNFELYEEHKWWNGRSWSTPVGDWATYVQSGLWYSGSVTSYSCRI